MCYWIDFRYYEYSASSVNLDRDPVVGVDPDRQRWRSLAAAGHLGSWRLAMAGGDWVNQEPTAGGLDFEQGVAHERTHAREWRGRKVRTYLWYHRI